VSTTAAALGLAVVALEQRGRPRAALGGLSMALLARAAAGYCPIRAAFGLERRRDDPKRALGGSRGVHIHESITIRAPVEVLFAFWANPANLPSVLPYLERVERLGNGRSRWVVKGPANVDVEWDAEVINEVPLETIAWQSLPDADVASAGSVRFKRLTDDRTELTVHMQYSPPAGRLGASLATLFGRSPVGQVREALRQLKQSMEAGEVPTTSGQPAGRRGFFQSAL
jgi:uncharacterized membrane protein